MYVLSLLSVTAGAKGLSGWCSSCLDSPGYPVVKLDDGSIMYRVGVVVVRVRVV